MTKSLQKFIKNQQLEKEILKILQFDISKYLDIKEVK